MNQLSTRLTLLTAMVLPTILGQAGAREGGGTPSLGAPAAPTAIWPSGRDWIAKTADNICGLKELSQISNPAVVDYKALLDATPEMKRIRSEKIDPASPEGIRLSTEAATRVAQKCEQIRQANGCCSVWKEIRHKDGRAITDITEQVKALL